MKCLKTIEEDLSEKETADCAENYFKKFGSKTSSSAIRRRQRAQYENTGTHVYVETNCVDCHDFRSSNHLFHHVFRNGNNGM